MARKPLLQRIKDQLNQTGYPARSVAARSWLLQNLRTLALNSSAKMAFINASANSSDSFSDNYFIGRLFFFIYDAKHKQRLKYWDQYPLVIPIEIYGDSFLGLNLHYLHPNYRAILLDKLETILTNRKYDNTTKMRISYSYLKKASKIIPPEAKPCIKKYLYSHIQSKFRAISAEDWDTVIFLPFESFTTQTQPSVTKNQVWKDSEDSF